MEDPQCLAGRAVQLAVGGVLDLEDGAVGPVCEHGAHGKSAWQPAAEPGGHDGMAGLDSDVFGEVIDQEARLPLHPAVFTESAQHPDGVGAFQGDSEPAFLGENRDDFGGVAVDVKDTADDPSTNAAAPTTTPSSSPAPIIIRSSHRSGSREMTSVRIPCHCGDGGSIAARRSSSFWRRRSSVLANAV